ncbi:hypothetical protein H2201_008968 [Coniosporium apollinis]|uniref:PD-(D/E)XK nuclease-like domain-containing protein n=1 Tax=Coniosporium apollinis TaxID=61459 RepID=A0ABQ9NFN1_9PEZI|nr:hypothetical protein H2201_008968 [Coniosporium apollinis]
MCESAVHVWLNQLAQQPLAADSLVTPPASPYEFHLLKRKAAGLFDSDSEAGIGEDMEDESGRRSPKRRKTTAQAEYEDDASSVTRVTEPSVRFEPSSAAGSRRGSPKRGLSPVRDQLRQARPPINCHPPVGHRLPPKAFALKRFLEAHAKTKIVPIQLKRYVQAHPVHSQVTIEKYEWDRSDPNFFGLDARKLQDLMNDVEKILKEAENCEAMGKDENAWCLHVIIPTLNLALALAKCMKIRLEEVKSQQIDPELLPRISDNSINKKADYTFCLCSHNLDDHTLDSYHPSLESIHTRLNWKKGSGVPRPMLGHTTDAYTKLVPSFSGIEVKKPGGDQSEAQLQLALWLSASIRNRQGVREKIKEYAANQDASKQRQQHVQAIEAASAAIQTRRIPSSTGRNSHVNVPESLTLQLHPTPSTDREAMLTEAAIPVLHLDPSTALPKPSDASNSDSAMPEYSTPILHQASNLTTTSLSKQPEELMDPEPGITIIGSHWNTFIAYHDAGHRTSKEAVGIVGPVPSMRASTNDVLDFFRLLKVLVAILIYSDNLLGTLTGERQGSAVDGLHAGEDSDEEEDADIL